MLQVVKALVDILMLSLFIKLLLYFRRVREEQNAHLRKKYPYQYAEIKQGNFCKHHLVKDYPIYIIFILGNDNNGISDLRVHITVLHPRHLFHSVPESWHPASIRPNLQGNVLGHSHIRATDLGLGGFL